MIPPALPSSPRLRVGFILARRFTLSAFANFVDVLRLAADEGDRSRQILCEWAILSDTMKSVVSSCGIMIAPDTRMGDPRDFDYLVVIGGLIDEIPNIDPGTLRYLRNAAAAGVPLAGICTGAFILHRAGLMEGYRACVSWFHHADFLEQFDGLNPVSDQIFVIDRDRLTCSGGVSSAHLAAHLVARHISDAAARKSMQIMIIDQALSAETAQPGVPIGLETRDEDVRRALLYMRQNLESPFTTGEIATRLGISRRSLERRFDAALGRTPTACSMGMRLDQAVLLLTRSDQPISAIAAATGFCDSSHLTRAFRRHRGTTPLGIRRETAAGHTEVLRPDIPSG